MISVWSSSSPFYVQFSGKWTVLDQYEIVKLLAERSGGEYELKEATMYSSVRRLEADGDIAWYWGDESQGGRRKYFRITEKGKATYDRNKSNWEYAKRVLDTLL